MSYRLIHLLRRTLGLPSQSRAPDTAVSPSAPETDAGLPLFLQQSATSSTTGQQEQEAEQTAADLTAATPQRGDTTAHISGQPLDPATRAPLEVGLGTSLHDVRLHTDATAAETAVAHNARAFTAGSDVVFGQGQFRPHTPDGRRLLAHELTHAAQQKRGLVATVQRQGLGDAPEAARKKVALPSTAVPLPEATVDKYFEKLKSGAWGARLEAPSGVTVTLSGIKDEFRTPMTSIAMEMAQSMSYNSPVTGQQKNVFGPNTTVAVYLKLARHGLADGLYRFSWVGDDQSGTIYIESRAGGPKEENQPSESGGKIGVGKLAFEARGSWSREQMQALKQALALVPLKALEQVDGLKFEIKSGSSTSGEDGHYDDDRHTVVLYSSAFRTSAARYGASAWPVQAIVHEIGHAVDLAPLGQAWQTYQAGGGESKLKAAMSQSGNKWQKDKSGTWQMAERLKNVDNPFRQAAAKDGVAVTETKAKDTEGREIKLAHLKGGPTEYATKNWTELYAESFALYVNDPETLKLIRPSMYAYLEKQFPRKSP
jgi:hypothetical protein